MLSFSSLRRLRTAAAGIAVVGAVALVPTAAQAYSTPTQSCTFTPFKYCYDDGGSPLARTNSQDIGSGKHMTSTATEFRNGLLTVDSYAKNDNWFYGMRPKTLVVAVDNMGRAIWVSQVFNSATVCGVTDPTCASQRRETFTESFPDAVGHYTADLRIYHADSPNYIDLRNRTIDAIKATGDIAQEIKDVLNQLQK
ncbi:hypothetical protein [Solirubrobacter soli]|uniref:hypothetical protein n=1 Tax=Solirubrobacter soli TaxID=363832 RepID=UPI000416C2D2|nr:hypothetical protein [Solirubrobacter soli]